MSDSAQNYVILFSTTGSMTEAETISDYLVSNHLAACVNILPSVRSVYWWNNQVNRDDEVLMVIKSQRSRISDIERSIRKLHSYEVPEIIAFPLEYGLPEYLKWMDQALSSPNNDSTTER
jgi:periplasmic divalent cation tolerance protein